ncbi:SRPBCC family protein [Flagellimonas lutimaris]|nr:SRPBCC family protein [Allomuricauda lutimaris]
MENKIDMATLLTEQEMAINADIESVYGFISNMENFKLWFPEVSDIASDNDMEHGTVGKTYVEKVYLPPNGEQRLKIEVKKVAPPVLYMTESKYEPLLPRMTITLMSKMDVTSVNWKMHSRNNDPDFLEEQLPNFKSIIAERANVGILKLKQLFEKK